MGVIRVLGRAERTVSFDRMKLTVEFQRRGADIGALTRDVQLELDALLEALANRGIPAADLRVEAERSHFETYPEPGTNVVMKSVSIARVLDRRELNALIETIAASAPNAHHSVEFSYADTASLDIALIEDAVRDARLRAESVARALGEDLGAVEKVDLTAGGVTPLPRAMALGASVMEFDGREEKRADDLEAGETTFVKEVVAEWIVGADRKGED